METWIALLRGINVGGNNILPMKDLRALLESLGLNDVQTYIQSGNCVFRSDALSPDDLSDQIATTIEKQFGFRPPTLVINKGELAQAIDANPFPDGDPKTVQLSFLFEKAENADLDTLKSLKVPSEQFTLTDKVFYLHAPDGIGRSKLVEKISKCIPVEMTGRNLRTAQKLLDMANA